MVDAVVDRAQRAGTTPLVEVAAEALVTVQRARANELRQLSLLPIEARRHRYSPRARARVLEPMRRSVKRLSAHARGGSSERFGGRSGLLWRQPSVWNIVAQGSGGPHGRISASPDPLI